MKTYVEKKFNKEPYKFTAFVITNLSGVSLFHFSFLNSLWRCTGKLTHTKWESKKKILHLLVNWTRSLICLPRKKIKNKKKKNIVNNTHIFNTLTKYVHFLFTYICSFSTFSSNLHRISQAVKKRKMKNKVIFVKLRKNTCNIYILPWNFSVFCWQFKDHWWLNQILKKS